MEELIQGYWWNDHSIPIVEIDGALYALYGWNGACFRHCWQVDPDNRKQVLGKKEFIIEPNFEITDTRYGYWIS